jgi:ribosomal protein S18 acetylase RimI-like enzyme
MEEMSIQRMELENIPQVLSLLRITVQKSYTFIPKEEFNSFFNFMYSENILKRYLNTKDDDLYVSILNTKIVGFIHASYDIGDLYCAIHALYILPEYQNSGIGSKLGAIIVKRIKELGIHRIHLGVFVDNKKTYELYQRLGFVTSSSRMEKIGDQQFEHLTGYFPVDGIVKFLAQKEIKM